MTAYIHRFIDMAKDIERTFEVITMAVYNILPDPLIRPSCYDHIGSDEVFKIARCALASQQRIVAIHCVASRRSAQRQG